MLPLCLVGISASDIFGKKLAVGGGMEERSGVRGKMSSCICCAESASYEVRIERNPFNHNVPGRIIRQDSTWSVAV